VRATTLPADLDEPLIRIQRDLFALGAMLADPSHRIATRVTKATLGPDDVVRLEALIDRLESELPPLRHFILAGGATAGASLHVARTVCRRAERRMVALDPAPDPLTIQYINRLSDLLFVIARVVNHRGGAPETEW
jgi:cob(I)alamin adenosyltransferase